LSSYYYLISSLPSLKANAQMPFDYSTFLKMCKASVSAKVYQDLAELSLESESMSLTKKWAEFYKELKRELNCLRKERMNKPFERSFNVSANVKTVAQNAFNASTPLEAEKILLDAQFEYLDSLVSMHYFDDTVLYGYALKLKLLERQNVFDFTEGSAEFKRLFDNVQQQILSI